MELIGAVYVLRDRPASLCTNFLRDALLAGIHWATAMRAALTLACSGATVTLGYAAAMTPGTTLLSQRELFDIPAEVVYLNCSYLAPQLRSVTHAGREASPDGGPVKKATQAGVLIPTKILTKDNVDSPEAKDYLVDRVWTEPGRGGVDFAAVLKVLSRFDGSYVVEVDLADQPTPKDSAAVSALWVREHEQGRGGVTGAPLGVGYLAPARSPKRSTCPRWPRWPTGSRSCM